MVPGKSFSIRISLQFALSRAREGGAPCWAPDVVTTVNDNCLQMYGTSLLTGKNKDYTDK